MTEWCYNFDKEELLRRCRALTTHKNYENILNWDQVMINISQSLEIPIRYEILKNVVMHHHVFSSLNVPSLA